MNQSSITRYAGLDVHEEAVAVGCTPEGSGAQAVSRGSMGTRPSHRGGK
jgi:hypothetical protein